MNSPLSADSYRLRTEKILTVALIATIGALWWSEAWGRYSFIRDYRSSFKIAVCLVSAFVGVRLLPKGLLTSTVISLVVALAFNPFLPLKLDRENWIVVDFVAGIALLYSLFQIMKASKVMTPERILKLQRAEARAAAINEGLADGSIDREKYEALARKLTGGKEAP